MNPASLSEAEKLAKASDIEDLIICPPFPFLETVAKTIKKAKLGAQDIFWEERGAYTGEVSPPELKSLCVEYAIIGHSERRKLGETDEMVAKKVQAAVQEGIMPILCVGESKEERSAGKAKAVVQRQVAAGLSLVNGQKLNVIIAYEPIWAIGTGTPDTPENTIEMVQFITGGLKNISVIYGGSVTSRNAEEFLKHKEIAGALVGGASLKGEEIKKIVEIGKKYI